MVIELKDEELEKVTGGEGETSEMKILAVEYKDTLDGITNRHIIGMVDVTLGKATAEDWCLNNNKIYVDYLFVTRVTNSYDTQKLLNTLTSGS